MTHPQYPEGKLNEDDEGALELKISTEGGKVVVHFGKLVSWFALGPTQAAILAGLILKHADAAASGRGDVQ